MKKYLTAWMNENEWMNVFQSFIQSCKHSVDEHKIICSGSSGLKI